MAPYFLAEKEIYNPISSHLILSSTTFPEPGMKKKRLEKKIYKKLKKH